MAFNLSRDLWLLTAQTNLILWEDHGRNEIHLHDRQIPLRACFGDISASQKATSFSSTTWKRNKFSQVPKLPKVSMTMVDMCLWWWTECTQGQWRWVLASSVFFPKWNVNQSIHDSTQNVLKLSSFPNGEAEAIGKIQMLTLGQIFSFTHPGMAKRVH